MDLDSDCTNRGFQIIKFQDRYGVTCSLQKSSLASEDAIWFGVDDAEPKVLATEAPAVGVKTSETTGWVPFSIPEKVHLNTRMHLTKSQVVALMPALQYFVQTGQLPIDL